MKKVWKWYVYILECVDGSYYTGRTWKTELRYNQHISGLGGNYTAKHGVKRLAYIEEFDNFEEAILREIQIKGWTRIKKEKLIKGEWSKNW
ncbi:MAG TPA: GIY-YIG nuclease family protein [Candidatus Saccharimonadales bacterium]|nr:GIY-YIG nuclease family protein [Candidatus Saccharimonadales bacterium]